MIESFYRLDNSVTPVRMTSYCKLTSLNFFSFNSLILLLCCVLCEDYHIIVSYLQFEV